MLLDCIRGAGDYNLAKTFDTTNPMPQSLLRRLLLEANLSSTEAAEVLNVSLQTVTNWTSGRSHIPVHRLVRITELLEERAIGRKELVALVRQELAQQGISRGLLDYTGGAGDAPIKRVALVTWNNALNGFAAAAPAFRSVMSRNGIECIVLDCMKDHSLKQSILEFLRVFSFDGLVLYTAHQRVGVSSDLQIFADEMTSQGVPVVLVGHTPDESHPSVTSVHWDIEELAHDATQLLIGGGHKAIGGIFYGGSESFHTENFNGFERALIAGGLVHREDLIIWNVGLQYAGSVLA